MKLPEPLTSVTEPATDASVAAAGMSRRGFLKLTGLAGGGFALAFYLGDTGRLAAAMTQEGNIDISQLNAYIQIASDGRIIIYAKNPDMGQGVKTALPMIIAEELDADWNDVHVEQSPINEKAYGRQFAGGSTSVLLNWDRMRGAGAAARSMLVSAAAARWGVPEAECSTANSTVTHKPGGRRLSYAELADAAAGLPVPDVKTLKFKDRGEYRILGTRVTGVDNHRIVTGRPLYGIDQKLPGMLYAAYEKCPATGGRVKSANLDEIKRLPGVKDAFILEGNGKVEELMPGVAIVATSTWAAFRAKKELHVEWDESEASKDSWSEFVRRSEDLARAPGGTTVQSIGDTEAALEGAARKLDAVYRYQFAAHANLEPQNCTGWYRDGKLELWAPTQTPGQAIGNIAHVLHIAKDDVTVHQTRVGGGFGRRLMNDYACEVAVISRHMQAPVKLQWTREDDMQHDFYRAGGAQHVQGGLDEAGRLIAWRQHLVTFTEDGKKPVRGADLRKNEFPLPIVANGHLSYTMLPLEIPCGWWRAPRSNTMAWVTQSFLHELSAAAGRDYLEFLLEIMGEPRWLEEGKIYSLNTGRAAAVIKLAAQKAGWGRKLPKGRGQGLAFYFSHAGHFAEVAEVSVSEAKKLTVHKVTIAGDVGPIINLSCIENQCEGAVMDGLSVMLGQEITMEKGRIQQANFNSYPVLRINHAPEVEAHFIQSDYAPTGAGEPALPPLAPAVCNAIYAATGHRVRTLPLTREGFTV
jgi:isoquinoline 1-oxidoreductase beta subunit